MSHQERPPASGTALPPSLASRARASDSLKPTTIAVAGVASTSLVAAAIASPELRHHGLIHPGVGECSDW
jgi:hypothetical protein